MSQKLNTLLACIPDSPFKVQLLTEIVEIQKQSANLEKQCKAYQSAWDAKDLNKQLSGIAFEQEHGVDFERAYSEVAKQRDGLLAALVQVRDWDDDRRKLGQMQMPPESRAIIDDAIKTAVIASVKGK